MDLGPPAPNCRTSRDNREMPNHPQAASPPLRRWRSSARTSQLGSCQPAATEATTSSTFTIDTLPVLRISNAKNVGAITWL
jgi:hypothetical protein